LFIYVAIVSVLYFSYLSFISAELNKDRLYKIADKKTIMVIGDSHTAYGINDSLLENVINLSQPADVYLYTYHKLKKVLPLNPRIKTVIIGIGGHSIEQFMSKVFLQRYGFTQAKVQNYYHLLSAAELTYLLGQSPSQVIKGVVGLPKLKTPYAVKILRSQPVTLDDLKIGGYSYHSDTINFRKELDGLANLEKNSVDVTSFWPWQIGYLHQAVDFCKSRNVNVIFVRIPEHKLYVRTIEPLFQKFLQEQFKEIPFVDYLRMDLPDSCYADLDHLNYNGAMKFTDTFRHFVSTIQ
jgi:hypothetical protein